MSTRRMRNTGLISTVSLLIIAIISVAATHEPAGNSRSPWNDSTTRQLYFDTALLKLNGTIGIDEMTIPAIILNKQAKEFTDSYIAKNAELLEKIQQNSARSFTIMDGIFSKYGLPLELKYLAVIESELKLNARSRVGAKGVWQLMPATARILSLKVNGKQDERTHLYKSTVAAAKYIRDLYKLFGDWTLVIAAYNSGPGTVYKAIKKSGSRNFWKLQHFLPAETRGHVKKFISTQYYFEGKAGITTMTRDETIAYKKKMIAFVEKHNALLKEQQQQEKADSTAGNSENIAIAVKMNELNAAVGK